MPITLDGTTGIILSGAAGLSQTGDGELTLNNTLDVSSGGTGANTLTGIVKGDGSNALTAGPVNLATEVSGVLSLNNGGTGGLLAVANGGTGLSSPGTTGNVLTSNGSYWVSSNTITSPTISGGASSNTTIINYTESVVAIGTVTTSSTLSLTNGTLQTATLTASTACTFTMPTAIAGKSFVLLLKQAAVTGSGTATFTNVKWGAAGAPTITATAGKMDILSFISDGTNWYGSASQGFTP